MDGLKHTAQYDKYICLIILCFALQMIVKGVSRYNHHTGLLVFVQFNFVSMTERLCPETSTYMCYLKTDVLKFLKFKKSYLLIGATLLKSTHKEVYFQAKLQALNRLVY